MEEEDAEGVCVCVGAEDVCVRVDGHVVVV